MLIWVMVGYLVLGWLLAWFMALNKRLTIDGMGTIDVVGLLVCSFLWPFVVVLFVFVILPVAAAEAMRR